jgi:polar amino acid transport system substrate-binding protein
MTPYPFLPSSALPFFRIIILDKPPISRYSCKNKGCLSKWAQGSTYDKYGFTPKSDSFKAFIKKKKIMKSIRQFTMIFLLASSMVFSLFGMAEAEEIIVATSEWKGYTNKDGTGYYFDLIREIFSDPQYSVKIKHVPFKRSIYMITRGTADIMLGAYPGDVSDVQLYARYPLERDTMTAIVGKDIAKNWKDLNSLKNKKVVAKSGYEIARFFSVPINYREEYKLPGMLKMLSKGYVDAVIDYKRDINKHRKEAGLGEEYVLIEDVIITESFACFAKHREDLKKHFHKKFKALYKSGRVKELMIKNLGDDKNYPKITF